jgi:lipooligosaccharide transport system permease protein
MSDTVSSDGAGRTYAVPAALDHAFPALRISEYYARLWHRNWASWVVTATVVPLLFLGALGLGLGGLVEESDRTVEGLDYLVFVTPGLLAANAIMAASGESLWPVLGGVKWNRVLHGAAASPVTPGQIYAGYLAWVATHVALNAALFLLVATLLGAVPSAWGVVAVPATVLGALSCAAPLAAFSAGQESDMPFAVIMRVLLLPMFLFSGTFYPVSQLPDALQPVVWITPLWHAVELCRGATTGTLGLTSALGHAAALLAFAAAGSWWGVRAFRARLAS